MDEFWVISFHMRSILIILCLLAATAIVWAGNDPVILTDVWNGHQVRFLAGTLRVRIQSGMGTSIARAQAVMPAGVSVRSQMLDPARTTRYGGLQRRPDLGDLHELQQAEDRLVRTFVVTFNGPVDPRRMASKLLSVQGIEVAEPWYVDELQGTTNDPFIQEQSYLSVIKALQAWDVYTGDPSIVIAVCDNGVDQTHEDLEGSLFARTTEIPNNGLDDDDNGYVDDHIGCNLAAEIDGDPGSTYHGDSHGTEVAGIVGATWNNATGIAGVAARCKIFPLKVSVTGRTGVIFGYTGILYAANNGFKVVNCSWGTVKPYSIIDQSVIDYAVAKGTVVVASGGNHGNRAGATPYDRNYPSAYRGVLGVGETTTLDRVTSSSGLGENTDLLAPGYEAYTTTSADGYTNFMIQGTSFASPMAAAMVGLIRAKHPQLSVEQTIAFARRCADDVRPDNATIAAGLPGRINLLKAVTTTPLTAPGIELLSSALRDANGGTLRRIPYDTPLRLALSVVNRLGPVTEMITEVRVIDAGDWIVSFSDAEGAAVSLGTGDRRVIDDLTFSIAKEGEGPLRLAVRFLAEDLDDERVILIDRQSNMTTMENSTLAYSIGDAGALGTYGDASTRLGIGFNWKPRLSMMSPSGIVITEGDQRAITGMNDIGVTSDLTVEKPFVEPDTSVGIMSDRDVVAERRIGVRVRLRATFPPEFTHANATVLHATITNTSGRTLNDLGAGYLLDWDLGSGGQANRSRLAPEGIPDTFGEIPALAQVFYREVPPVQAAVMCGVVSSDANAQPQAAAFPYGDILSDGLSTQEMIDLLRSGSGIQTTLEDDLAGLVGMRFPGALPDGASKDFLVVIVVSPTIEAAGTVMRELLLDPMSVPTDDGRAIRVMPQPAQDEVMVEVGSGARRILVHDMQGKLLHAVDVVHGSEFTTIECGSWANGIYQLTIEYGTARQTVPLCIVR